MQSSKWPTRMHSKKGNKLFLQSNPMKWLIHVLYLRWRKRAVENVESGLMNWLHSLKGIRSQCNNKFDISPCKHHIHLWCHQIKCINHLTEWQPVGKMWKYWVPVGLCHSFLHRRPLGSSRYNVGEEDCATTPKSVCVGGTWVTTNNFAVLNSYRYNFDTFHWFAKREPINCNSFTWSGVLSAESSVNPTMSLK